jgi:hypothetical protein
VKRYLNWVDKLISFRLKFEGVFGCFGVTHYLNPRMKDVILEYCGIWIAIDARTLSPLVGKVKI